MCSFTISDGLYEASRMDQLREQVTKSGQLICSLWTPATWVFNQNTPARGGFTLAKTPGNCHLLDFDEPIAI